MRISVSDIFKTSKLYVLRKAFGGSEDSSQFMAKKGLMEQLEFMPTPKGYGTVKLPHFLEQVMLGPSAAILVHGKCRRNMKKNLCRTKLDCILGFRRMQILG